MNKKNTNARDEKEFIEMHLKAISQLSWARKKSNHNLRTFKKWNNRIEHTILKPDSSFDDLENYCRQAIHYDFKAVCCLSKDVSFCKKMLGGTLVKVVTVVGFPLCQDSPLVLKTSALAARDDGADEIDMVADLRAIKSGDLNKARDHVNLVTEGLGDVPVKVILETGLLTGEQMALAAATAEAGGAAFLKTSTGFGPSGATCEDISLLNKLADDYMGIKASGGISDYTFAKKLVIAGAHVIGTSKGVLCLPEHEII